MKKRFRLLLVLSFLPIAGSYGAALDYQGRLARLRAGFTTVFQSADVTSLPALKKRLEALKSSVDAPLDPADHAFRSSLELESKLGRFESIVGELSSGTPESLARSVSELGRDLTPGKPLEPVVRRYLRLRDRLNADRAGKAASASPASLLAVQAVAPENVGDRVMDGQGVARVAALSPAVSAQGPPAKASDPGKVSLKPAAPEEDPYLWLEPIRGEKPLEWAAAQNKKTEDRMTADPRYAKLKEELSKIYLAKDKFPAPELNGEWIHNFWQDEAHPRGVWRRIRAVDYQKPQQQWEILLDLDALSAAEKEKWVWHGGGCLPPQYERCLVSLSRGGKDADVVREFDIRTKSFVEGGFSVPEAKTSVAWADADHVWIGTDFGPGSMTDSGYPRVLKLWKRGTPLSEAKTVFEGKPADIAVSGGTYFQPEGSVAILQRAKTFFSGEIRLVAADGASKAIPLPEDAAFKGVFQGKVLATLRSPWKTSKRALPAGALISFPLDKIGDKNPEIFAQVVYSPDSRSAFSSVAVSKDHLYLNVLRDVQGQVLQADFGPKGWRTRPLAFPDKGVARVINSDPLSNRVLAAYDSLITPMTVYSVDGAAQNPVPQAFRRQPARFDSKDLVVEQRRATSKDGVQVPYFLVRRKGIKFDGNNPTLLYGYGGFEASMLPDYDSVTGKAWLEKGGVYVLANIRGGGEFGPRWHQAALQENRQRAYDDFLAVSSDLIKKKVTSPRRLGIMGGSNGGLLVGAALTQRPELFGAVVCEVPLLDMLRYPKIGAGASWVGEYGDPEDPRMAAVLSRYSPYHNLKPGVKYPEVLFTTSTGDDRVEPAHARKMAAKMQAMGAPVLYHETLEGGHSSSDDIQAAIEDAALKYTYLYQKLFDQAGSR